MISLKVFLKSIKFLGLFFVGLVFINMGGGLSKNEATTKIVTLEKGEPSYVAKIVTMNSVEEEIKDLAFSGKTIISGIRRESDGAEIQINISNFKEFVVADPHYLSSRFGGQEFIKVDCFPSSPTAAPVRDLLFPRDAFITAKSFDGSYNLSLRLWEIKRVVISGRKEIVEDGNSNLVLEGREKKIAVKKSVESVK